MILMNNRLVKYLLLIVVLVVFTTTEIVVGASSSSSSTPTKLQIKPKTTSTKLSTTTTTRATTTSASAAATSSSSKSLSLLKNNNNNNQQNLNLVLRNIRKFCNVKSLVGIGSNSQLSYSNINNYEAPYDRITSNPVFAVTTAWGSPYLNMEKLTDLDEVISTTGTASNTGTSSTTGGTSKAQSLSEEQNEYRMIGLYFTDIDDAISMLNEMKQLDNMSNNDIRITSISLGKALRHTSNVGSGLVTGAQIDTKTGNLNPPDDGSILRYKLVPSTRQLYYASRCIGKERIGFGFTDSSSSTSSSTGTALEEAQASILGRGTIDGYNLMRRREKRERKTPKRNLSPLQQQYQHMDGYSGIPIFYCTNMYQQRPLLQRLFPSLSLSNNNNNQQYTIPMFFNYEDLIDTYNNIKSKTDTGATGTATTTTSNELPQVEVFNLWDVVTSIDRYQYEQKKQQHADFIKSRDKLMFWKSKNVMMKSNNDVKQSASSDDKINTSSNIPNVDINCITFIPNSRCVRYKDYISTCGNGKARLRPMRNFQ